MLLTCDKWLVACQAKNYPGVAFPAKLYWPSRPDGFTMREMIDVNFGKFRIFTFAGVKEPQKSHEDAGYRMVPFGYAEEFTRPMDPNSLSPWQCNESMWAETVHVHLPRTPPYVRLPLGKYPEGTWEFKALDEYFIAINRYALHAFHLVDRYPHVALPAALFVFEQGMRDLPTEKCDCALDQYSNFFRNAGTCYYQSIGKEIGNLQQHKRRLKRVWGEYFRRVREGFLGEPSYYDREVASFRQILANPLFSHDPSLDSAAQGVSVELLAGDGAGVAGGGAGVAGSGVGTVSPAAQSVVMAGGGDEVGEGARAGGEGEGEGGQERVAGQARREVVEGEAVDDTIHKGEREMAKDMEGMDEASVCA